MSSFVFYNRNPAKLESNDCVVRAISLVSGLPYGETMDKLYYTSKVFGCDMLDRSCYRNYVERILGGEPIFCRGLTVGELADENPVGKYLVRVKGHLTAIINSKIYDEWDCRDEFCDLAWFIP